MKLKLKEWMTIRGVNQTQLAEGLGIKIASVNAWLVGRNRGDERVRVYPDYGSLEAICNFLECTPNDVLEFEALISPTGKTWRDFSHLLAA